MIDLLFGLTIAILLTCIVSIFFWSKVKFEWLPKLCNMLILSLPFEYFPRLEIGGTSWRISQFLVMIGFWIIAILVLKKDSKLLSHKLHFASMYPLLLLFLSSPSWFAVVDFQRFVVHLVGTVFVFGAFVLLINFATNIWKNLQRLALVLFGCSIFGLYQFFGDLVGIPPALTLLREHYTKVVFGVPRVQGTAVEPLYFAGMLLIAIFVLFFWICERVESKKISSMEGKGTARFPCDILSEGWQPKVDGVVTTKATPTVGLNNSQLQKTTPSATLPPLRMAKGNLLRYLAILPINIDLKYLLLILLTTLTAFVLTISKGTFGVLAILLLPLILVIIFAFSFAREFVGKYFIQTILIAILGLTLVLTFINPVTLLGEIGTNFVETLSGTSASAVERSMFVSEAIVGIKQHLFFGIGMGQFGEYAGNNLGLINAYGKAIVNNVYLEIWLEQGILALFFFVFFLLQPVLMLLKFVATRWLPLCTNMLAALSLVFILVGYYIQWTLFSPIFIMPIFICLGLAYNLILSEDL
jgi:O-Antigen ligase